MDESDIIKLIEEKIQKEKDKVISDWEEEGIKIEKARWGRSNIIKGKLKIELPKTVDASKISLQEAQDRLAAIKGKKKKATSKKK